MNYQPERKSRSYYRAALPRRPSSVWTDEAGKPLASSPAPEAPAMEIPDPPAHLLYWERVRFIVAAVRQSRGQNGLEVQPPDSYELYNAQVLLSTRQERRIRQAREQQEQDGGKALLRHRLLNGDWPETPSDDTRSDAEDEAGDVPPPAEPSASPLPLTGRPTRSPGANAFGPLFGMLDEL